MQIRVYYEDTDSGGIVYHSNYLNFCERARSDAFFQKNITPELQSGYFVVKKIVAEYLKSAKLGDILEVKSKLLNIKAASFTLKQTVCKNDVELFKMEVILAYLDYEGKVQKFDDYTKELINILYG